MGFFDVKIVGENPGFCQVSTSAFLAGDLCVEVLEREQFFE